MYSRRLNQAKDVGWPISIDFDELPPWISALVPSLSTLLSNSAVLARSPVWNKFLTHIEYKVFTFSRSSKNLRMVTSAADTLIQTDIDNDEDMSSNDLYATLSQLLDTRQPWDLYDETSNLISPRKFLNLILILHLLIAKDLEITMNDAVEVLENSSEYGRLFSGDLPEKVDIVAANPQSSQPPRHRKPAVNLKLPAPKLITLQNFPPVLSRPFPPA
ncbi:hypothetical protein B0H11DRAFT_1911193 [Mycena galericulata]|nr:hypothetical protein B0H11DRAFT_1911193 [Mycena galericulata]